VGRVLSFNKVGSDIHVCLDGVVLGHLDNVVGPQVAAAMNLGQTFDPAIEKCYPTYDSQFKVTGGRFFLKVEYLLATGQRAIESPKPLLPESKPATKSFFTKVAGTTHEGRQHIIVNCRVGESLMLVREPNNPVDSGAIKVMRLNGEQLGYIPAHVSRGGDRSGLAYKMDKGDQFQCRIKDITGGYDGLYRGVNIEITEADDVGHQLRAPEVPVKSHLGSMLFAGILLLALCVLLSHC
jgi:hypothetical protein